MSRKQYLPKPGKSLSMRESEILDLLVSAGLKAGEIAKLKGLSARTISTYRRRMLAKLSCANDAQLGAWYERRRAASFNAPALAVEIKYDANGVSV